MKNGSTLVKFGDIGFYIPNSIMDELKDSLLRDGKAYKKKGFQTMGEWYVLLSKKFAEAII